MTPVIPSTNMARSRMAEAGVDTGAKMLGVGAGPAATASPAVRRTPPRTLPLHATRDAVAAIRRSRRPARTRVLTSRAASPRAPGRLLLRSALRFDQRGHLGFLVVARWLTWREPLHPVRQSSCRVAEHTISSQLVDWTVAATTPACQRATTCQQT